MTKPQKILLIAALVLITTLLHYVTDQMAGTVHDFYQRFYYLPVILGGLWFGVKGGLLTAFCIAVIYFPHLYQGWHGPHSLYFRLMEVGMYHVIGALTGYLSLQAQRALAAEKTSRAAKEKAYDDLRRKTEDLFALEEQLRRSDRLAALGRLSAGLAHEIRNPLGSIKTAVEILRDRNTPDPQMQTRSKSESSLEDNPNLHHILLEETERLDRILNDFLNFARSEEQGEESESRICRIVDPLKKTVQLLDNQLAKKGIRIEYDEAELSCDVTICDSHLRQVFLNLMLNSMDALPDGGIIRIGYLKREEPYFTFAFEDNGPGIKPEIAPRIFDPFFSMRESGTGLGLSIAERIIDTHKGRLSLEKSTAPTAKFIISLLAAANR